MERVLYQGLKLPLRLSSFLDSREILYHCAEEDYLSKLQHEHHVLVLEYCERIAVHIIFFAPLLVMAFKSMIRPRFIASLRKSIAPKAVYTIAEERTECIYF